MLVASPALDLARAFVTQPTPQDFVIPGLVAGSVGMLTSPGGVGKSMLALEIAMGVAAPGADSQLLDLGIRRKGSVLILNAEDPADVLGERAYNIGALLDDDTRDAVSKQLCIRSLRSARPNLLDAAWVDAISEMTDGTRLLIIDTFSRFHSGDENSNAEMADVISSIERITARTGAAVLALHHTSKGAALNGQQSSQQSARGASAIVDNARWQGYLEVMSEKEALTSCIPTQLRRNFVSFGISKQNYGRPIAPKWLTRLPKGVLVPVDFGNALEVNYCLSQIQALEQDDDISFPTADSPAEVDRDALPEIW